MTGLGTIQEPEYTQAREILLEEFPEALGLLERMEASLECAESFHHPPIEPGSPLRVFEARPLLGMPGISIVFDIEESAGGFKVLLVDLYVKLPLP